MAQLLKKIVEMGPPQKESVRREETVKHVKAFAKREEKLRVMAEAGIKQSRQALGLTPEDFATLLGVSLRTLVRWEQGAGKPSKRAAEKLRRLRQCVDSLRVAMKEERIPQWLAIPNEALGGRAPRDVLFEEDGLDRVVRLAGWLEWGIPG
jgi:DNA-binding transcriptional regulator YiaG